MNPNAGYTSPELIPNGPNNVEQITPSVSAQLFFMKKGVTGAMKTRVTLYPIILDFEKGVTEFTIRLDREAGIWVEEDPGNK